jgi:hypothetical protein
LPRLFGPVQTLEIDLFNTPPYSWQRSMLSLLNTRSRLLLVVTIWLTHQSLSQWTHTQAAFVIAASWVPRVTTSQIFFIQQTVIPHMLESYFLYCSSTGFIILTSHMTSYHWILLSQYLKLRAKINKHFSIFLTTMSSMDKLWRLTFARKWKQIKVKDNGFQNYSLIRFSLKLHHSISITAILIFYKFE